MSLKHIIPGIINQVEPPALPVSQVKTETSIVIKNEPPESETMDINMDNILDSSDIPDIKDIDIVWHPLCKDSVKSETVPGNLFESKHLESVEVFIQTENTPIIKIENITQNETSNKTKDIGDGNENRSTGEEAIEMQVEASKQLLNHSKDLNSTSTRSRKAKHSKQTDFEFTSWKKAKEKIKVIEAPLISVEPHEFTSLAKDKHVCNHCHHTCNLLQNLRRHIKRRHRKVTTMYQCPYCSFKSKWKLNLKRHIIRQHKDPKDIQWYFPCDHCDFKTPVRATLKRHNLIHLKPEESQYFYCYHCSFKSKHKTGVQTHIFRRHFKNVEIERKEKRQKTKEEIDGQDLKYCCDKCVYKTYKSNSLKTHKLVHVKPEDIQYFYCDHCSYKCPRKSQLKRHNLKHYKQHQRKHKKQLEKRYNCDECDYETYTNQMFKRHKLVHLKPEEIQYFYCYHCSFKSKHKDSLRSHISRHFRKEVVPFNCYICNFLTLKRESIIEHIKKHSKVQFQVKIGLNYFNFRKFKT